jgi:hypothetical protein
MTRRYSGLPAAFKKANSALIVLMDRSTVRSSSRRCCLLRPRISSFPLHFGQVPVPAYWALVFPLIEPGCNLAGLGALKLLFSITGKVLPTVTSLVRAFPLSMAHGLLALGWRLISLPGRQWQDLRLFRLITLCISGEAKHFVQDATLVVHRYQFVISDRKGFHDLH